MMGTKRAFDEDLLGFNKHPKRSGNGNRIATEDGHKDFDTANGVETENEVTVPDMVFKGFELSKPLPLVTGISTDEDDLAPGPVFPAILFSEFFENNFRRRQLFHINDRYISLMDGPPSKEIPVGQNHQADVPEYNPELAKYYIDSSAMECFLGVCVIPAGYSIFDSDTQMDCKCFDHGSVTCVQQHVKEASLKLKEFYGDEKFVNLGMLDMGEEVACKWSEEEERTFHEVVYLNPASLGRKFWQELSVSFPSRTKKELVSYYFNVFVLRRRAVQNRSQVLDIDSDDDEWGESYGWTFCDRVDDDDFVLGDDVEGAVVIGIEDSPTFSKEVNVKSSVSMNGNMVTSEFDLEKLSDKI